MESVFVLLHEGAFPLEAIWRIADDTSAAIAREGGLVRVGAWREPDFTVREQDGQDHIIHSPEAKDALRAMADVTLDVLTDLDEYDSVYLAQRDRAAKVVEDVLSIEDEHAHYVDQKMVDGLCS